MFNEHACYSGWDWMPKELAFPPWVKSFHSFHPFKDFIMVYNKDTLVELNRPKFNVGSWLDYIPFQHVLAGTDSLTGDFHKFVNVYEESFPMTRLCEICHVKISIKGSISMCLHLIALSSSLNLLMHVWISNAYCWWNKLFLKKKKCFFNFSCFFFINCCAPGMLSKLVTVRMTLPMK